MKEPNIPDAPPALRFILRALLQDGSGLMISQHQADPKPVEWFAGIIQDGEGGHDLGPYETAEKALIAGVHWLYDLYRAGVE
jgi:hypothetical protein